MTNECMLVRKKDIKQVMLCLEQDFSYAESSLSRYLQQPKNYIAYSIYLQVMVNLRTKVNLLKDLDLVDSQAFAKLSDRVAELEAI